MMSYIFMQAADGSLILRLNKQEAIALTREVYPGKAEFKEMRDSLRVIFPPKVSCECRAP